MPEMTKSLQYVRDLMTDLAKQILPNKLPLTTDKFMQVTQKIMDKCVYPDEYVVNHKNFVLIKQTDCDFQQVCPTSMLILSIVSKFNLILSRLVIEFKRVV